MSLFILMCIIKTTLSFIIRRCYGCFSNPINMLRFVLAYILSYALSMIILYGYAIIEPIPMEKQHAKWWDCVWNDSFHYLASGIQPIMQYITKYVEAIHLQPCIKKSYSPHRRIHYSTGLNRKLAYTAIIAMSTQQNYNVAEAIPFDTDSQMIGIDN